MSELQFPKDPIVGQQYDFPPYKYYWDGFKWKTLGIGYNPVNDLRNDLEPRIESSEKNIEDLSAQSFEALRRSYAEAGFTLVDGSFEEGGTLTSPSDVLLHKATGIAYSGPIGTVVAGTDPAAVGSGYVQRSDALLRGELSGNDGAGLVSQLPYANAQKTALSTQLRRMATTEEYGAQFNGSSSAVSKIQEALNTAWNSLYYAHPWSGNGSDIAYPIATVRPGRYKLDGTLTMATGTSLQGMSHPAHTTNHTRLIMDSTATGGIGDNRNKPILRFSRATSNGAALANTALTCSIENLEFWYVTMGNDFDNPLSGAGIPFGDYPDGGTLLFDVEAIDTRIKNCVFQHSPAAIRIKDVNDTTTNLRPDGYVGNSSGVGLFIDDCEFDAGCAHVYATSSHVDLVFNNCQFFGGVHYYAGCTGKVVYKNCKWHGGAYIDAATEHNALDVVIVDGGEIEPPTSKKFMSVYFSDLNKKNYVKFSADVVSESVAGVIDITNANSGTLHGFGIDNAGYNVAPVDPATDSAAVLLSGCRNLAVSGINLTATATVGATYGGFGIKTQDSADRTSANNFVSDNAVSAPYNGATYRGQSRHINLAPGDIRGSNHVVSAEAPVLNVSGGMLLEGVSVSQDGGPLGSNYSLDLLTAIPDTGAYLVFVESSPVSNKAARNSATYLFTKISASAYTLAEVSLVNGVSQGAISKSGSSIVFTYGTELFVVGVSYNRLSKLKITP